MKNEHRELRLRALEIFEHALELGDEQRAVYLDQLCSENSQLRENVNSLLAVADDADEFLPDEKEVLQSTCFSDERPELPLPTDSLRLRNGFRLIDRYTIVETIGSGGMGEVYRATDSVLDRDVAVKVLNLDSVGNDDMQLRFDREMKSVASLSHPNIVTLHDVASHEEVRFAVMELVEGKTLRHLISKPILWREAVKFAHGIASGLSNAHDRNLIHRDIKPENVIVSCEGHAKILDFGIARPEVRNAQQALTAETALVPGTVPYMSPEQVESKELACSTDVFSLGTLFIEMLTGKNPFRADTAFQTMRNIVEVNAQAIAGSIENVPGELSALLAAVLAKQPDQRPSAAHLVVELEKLLRRPGDSAKDDTDSSQSETAGVSSNDADAIDSGFELTKSSTNLPRRSVELTGRDAEIENIANRIESDAIVTLVGPGGVGKTSLTIQIGRDLNSKFPGGVWFCEFASLRDGANVQQVLASVLYGNAGSMSEMDTLVERLQEQPTLLIFDNCEHIVDAVAELSKTLFESVSHLKILASSREPLNVAGESVVRLNGLKFTGAKSGAAELFVNRAKSLADFDVTPGKSDLVERIVTRLEGLPLAIELAAPQLSMMSLEELLAALDDQLSTLRTPRDSDHRQATVGQAIAWSFELLAPKEQGALLALSVFAAPFTSEAALAVSDLPVASRRILQRLVEQSVVVKTERKGQSRFRLLEPIRQFCQSRIDADAHAAAQHRHAHFYAERAKVLGRGIYGFDELKAVHALNVEWPDLRKAVAWGREHSVSEIAIDPIVAINRAAMFHLRVEAYQWMEKAVEVFGDAATKRADVHHVFGTGMWIIGAQDHAQSHLDLSESIEQTAGNMYLQYSQLFSQNRFLDGMETMERARDIAQANGDELELRWLLLPYAANTLTMVDPTDARIDQSLATASNSIEKLDWPTGKAYLLMNFGTVAMTRGDLATATVHLKQCIELSNSCGNRALATLTGIMVAGFPDETITPRERLESALKHWSFMIESGVETGDVSFYPVAIRSIVVALVDCNQLESAAKFSAIVDSLKGSGDHNELSPQFLPAMKILAEKLGQDQFVRLQHKGKYLTVDEIAETGEQILNSMEE